MEPQSLGALSSRETSSRGLPSQRLVGVFATAAIKVLDNKFESREAAIGVAHLSGRACNVCSFEHDL